MSSNAAPPDDVGLGLFSESGAGGAGGGPRHQQRKRRWPKRLLIGFVVLVVVLAIIVGLYVFTIGHSFTHNLKRSGSLPPQSPSAAGQAPRPKKAEDNESVNYVLLGSDSRDPANMKHNGRSDTLMVLHLDGNRHAASVISFPRDMYVHIPGRKNKNKINAAYAFGGPQLTVRTLESLTHARVDHVIQVNFEGFIQLTNDLDGVTVTNDHAFTRHGRHYAKGTIRLEGKRALGFVRERHKLARGDLDRAANQRKVVKAILAKGLSKQTVAHPGKFSGFVSGVAKNLVADKQLTNHQIRKTALSLRMGAKNVHQLQAPVAGFEKVPGVGDVDVVDTHKMSELSRALRGDDLAGYRNKYPGG